MASVSQAPLLQLPNALAPMPFALDQARGFHHPQVFGDGLASDLGSRGEAGNRQRAFIAQAENDPQAGLVTQRRENGSG